MRRAQRIGLLSAVVAALVGAAAAPAGACSIAAVPDEDRVAQAAMAFTGTVQQVTSADQLNDALTVTVDRVVKGTLVPGATVTLSTRKGAVDMGDGTTTINSCAMSFAPGQRAAFLLSSAQPPWAVGIGSVLPDAVLDAMPRAEDFHATAITALYARPALRNVRVAFTAPACATLAAIVHERAGDVRLGLRTATTPACLKTHAPPVRRCVTLTLRRAAGARLVQPHRAARRAAVGSPAACPRVGAFAS